MHLDTSTHTFVQIMMPPYINISHSPSLLLQTPAFDPSAQLLFLLYFALPNENGTYRYLIMCWICLLTAHLINSHPTPSHSSRKLTGQRKQNQPVDHQHRPENRHIEDREPGAEKPNSNRSRSRIPELELRKTADEGAELLILFCGQASRGAVFHLVVYGFI
jgi:hypothetical protein